MVKKIILFISVVFGGCQRTIDMQTLERKNYSGSELKIDGYYYSFSKTTTGESLGTIFFLYKNGVFLYLGTPKASTILELDQKVLEYKPATNIREYWGVFQVNGNQISIERWLLSSGRNIPAKVFKGEILNDTTMSMELFANVETWKFRAFTPKPDSTNAYVK
jgi:hypothetical protein